MRSKYTFILFVVLWTASGPLYAQQSTVNAFTEQDLRNLGNITPYSTGVTGFDNRYEGVKGSPLWFEDWQTGFLTVQGKGKLAKSLPLQLDVYNQIVYFRLEDKVNGSLPAKSIQSIAMENGETWQSFPEALVEAQKSEKWKFYRVLHNQNYLLLKCGEKILKKADYQGAYSPDRRYDEFITEESYYFSADRSSFEKIRLKKKQLLKLFPDREKQVNDLLEKNNWDIETESGLISLLQALEQK